MLVGIKGYRFLVLLLLLIVDSLCCFKAFSVSSPVLLCCCVVECCVFVCLLLEKLISKIDIIAWAMLGGERGTVFETRRGSFAVKCHS